MGYRLFCEARPGSNRSWGYLGEVPFSAGAVTSEQRYTAVGAQVSRSCSTEGKASFATGSG